MEFDIGYCDYDEGDELVDCAIWFETLYQGVDVI